jgi:predicted small secreted protein
LWLSIAGRDGLLADYRNSHEGLLMTPRLLYVALIALIAMLLLSACGTLGGVVEGTGRVIQKGGRTIKNI